jgi:hypothetical protein
MSTKVTGRKTLVIGLTVALFFVMAGVFCFSYALETLDVKAEELGAVEQPIYEAPFPDYGIVGFENQWGALIVGVTSTLLLFIAGLGVAKLVKKKKGK